MSNLERVRLIICATHKSGSFKVLTFLVAWLLIFFSTQADARTVLVGIYQNDPKIFTTESGQPAGIFVDVIEYVARKEDWQLRFIPGTWAECLDRLGRGEIDLMPDVSFTTDREQIYSFHQNPVLSSWVQIYAQPGSGIKSILDLNGKKVSVLDQSVQQRAFQNLITSFDIKVALIPLPDYDKAFLAVKEGKADAVVANNFYGAKHFRKHGLEDTAVVFHPSTLFFAAPKNADKDLLAALDKHILQMKKDKDSEYYRSIKRWISEDVQFQIPDWLKRLGLIVSALLIMSLIGSFILNRQVQSRTRELKESNEQLISMDRMLRATATQVGLQAIMDNAVRGVLELTGLESGILCLARRPPEECDLRVAVNVSEAIAASLQALPIRMGECLIGRAIQNQEPLIIENHASESHFASRDSIRKAGIQFFAGFPLHANDQIIGVLCVFSFANALIDSRKLNLVRDICAPLALAIENARLYEQIKLHTEELEQRVSERTEELQIAMEKARTADHLKSAFLATMSHELRTPLNSIIGFTGILLQGLAGPLNAEQQKQMGMVQGSSRHLLALINDVLDISKIEAGQLRLSISTFDLRVSIEKMVKLVSPSAEKKKLNLRLDLAPDLTQITLDQCRFEQVILNLINNAVKYSDKGQIIVQSYLENAQTIIVSVSDTGIGIKEENLAHLFQPFYQVETGLARKYEGTGLGLSITRKLLDMMGGTIAVTSRIGHGSTFTIRLPRSPGDTI